MIAITLLHSDFDGKNKTRCGCIYAVLPKKLTDELKMLY